VDETQPEMRLAAISTMAYAKDNQEKPTWSADWNCGNVHMLKAEMP